jgi:hypothetical protein
MSPKRKKDVTENYFGTLPTVYIHAKYQDDKYYDIISGKEVKLSNGSIVRIKTLLANIAVEDYPKFEEIKREVLPQGSILSIRMPISNEGEYKLILRLKSPLVMKKTGNKEAIVEPCFCEVFDCHVLGGFGSNLKFDPFIADSLNQAFFQASIRFRPDNKSHTTNIYQSCFLEDGRSLASLRF